MPNPEPSPAQPAQPQQSQRRKVMPPKSSHKKAAHDAAAARRLQVAELRLAGKTMTQIAEKLGVTSRTIHKDVKILREGWQARMAQSYDAHMAQRFERANAIFAKAWANYQASVTKDKPAGVPSLLETARKAEMDIRTLLGLSGPVEFQGKRVVAGDGDQGGGSVNIVEVVVDDRDELAEITNERGSISLADYKRRLQESVANKATSAEETGT